MCKKLKKICAWALTLVTVFSAIPATNMVLADETETSVNEEVEQGTVYFKVPNAGGQILVTTDKDTDEENIQTITVTDEKTTLTDKDGNESDVTLTEEGYCLEITEEVESVVNIEIMPADGYEVGAYHILSDTGDVKEEPEISSENKYTVTISKDVQVAEILFSAVETEDANADEVDTLQKDSENDLKNEDADEDETTDINDINGNNEVDKPVDISKIPQISTFSANSLAATRSSGSFKTLVDYWDTNVNVEVVNNSGKVVDDWHESIIGSSNGNTWAYCADPTQKFWDGSFTSKNAVNQYNTTIVKKLGALMYWSDKHITCRMADHLRYALNTSIVWNVLNKNSGHWVNGWYYAGRGQKDKAGHNMTTHIKSLYSTGWDWMNNNYQYMNVSATYWYRSGSQPIITLSYTYNPTGSGYIYYNTSYKINYNNIQLFYYSPSTQLHLLVLLSPKIKN